MALVTSVVVFTQSLTTAAAVYQAACQWRHSKTLLRVTGNLETNCMQLIMLESYKCHILFILQPGPCPFVNKNNDCYLA